MDIASTRHQLIEGVSEATVRYRRSILLLTSAPSIGVGDIERFAIYDERCRVTRIRWSLTVSAVVVRGGRPDLTGPRLATVHSPTLFVVGGADPVVLDLNRAAAERLNTTHDLIVVPGAGHLFEGPGEMGTVAELAGQWFLKCLIDQV